MRNCFIILIITCFVSCDNEFDAEKAAERYCNCMKSNGAVEHFNKASLVCDGELMKENRFFKLYAVDMNDRELDKKVSDETRDSVKSFVLHFIDYTKTNCCEETLSCP